MIRLLNDRLEQHFPTMVMVREHGGMEQLNSDLTQVIAGLDIELGKTSRNAATNGDSTTRGGFQTPADMAFLDLDDAAVKVLKAQIILPGIEEYLSQVFHADPLYTDFRIKSWANILGQGNWQSPHIHPKEYTLISGVYYAQVPATTAPSGHLEFINPVMASVAIGGQAATRLHRPEPGQLLLFPPYYMHFVHPVSSDQQRSIVAFDVRLNP